MNKKVISTIFLLIFLFYTFGIKSFGSFYKILLFMLIGQILVNVYFYDDIIKYIRKSLLKQVNYIVFFTISILILMVNNIFAWIYLVKKICTSKYLLIYLDTLIYDAILYSIIFLGGYFIFKEKKDSSDLSQKRIISKDDLVSFRKEELYKLKELVKDKSISSILIDAKIGNGKTTLIENYLYDSDNKEIIYFKLPFIKSCEELKKILFNELKKIFIKYDLENSFLDDFTRKVSSVKIGFLEINTGPQEKSWDNIRNLKSKLEVLSKKKVEINIILDDVEREKNEEKVREVIMFLGELAEYFQNTDTTILILAQCSHLNKIFNSKITEEQNLKSENEELEVDFFEKYFKYHFIMKEPLMNYLNENDIMLFFNKSIENSQLNLEQEFIDKSIITIYIFFAMANEVNLNILLNMRNLVKACSKIIYLNKIFENSPLAYLVLVFCTLKDQFLIKNIEKRKYENLKELYYNKLFSMFNNLKIFNYNKLENQIKKVENKYLEGEVCSFNIETAIEIIEKIFRGEKVLSIKKFSAIDNIIIAGCINNNPEKLDLAIKNDLITTKSFLIDLILEMNGKLKFSLESISKINEILLNRELTNLEEYDIAYEEYNKENFKDEMEARFYEEMPFDKKIEIEDEKIKERNRKFLDKINEISDLKNNLSEIEECLDCDRKENICEYREILKKEENRL